MLKKINLLLFCLLLAVGSAAQTPSKEDEKTKKAELEKQSVAFLRETFADVNNLRTPENRIGFNAEMAALMWFYDEKEARSMFEAVITDFRQMLFQLNAQLSAVKIDADESALYSVPFLPASSPQAKLMKKLNKAMGVRKQIALAVSEHDPVLAYDFYEETGQVITNPDLKKPFENPYNDFSMKLLQAIAEKDPDKALESARKSLAKGVKTQHFELLKKIYEKDADKGAAFGEEIVSRVKSDSAAKDDNLYHLTSILSAGIENREELKDNPAQKPLFSDAVLRETAEMTAQILFKRKSLDEYGAKNAIESVKEILPGRGAQLEQKLALEMKKKAANKASDEDGDDATSPMVSAAMSRAEKMQEQREVLENLQKLGAKKLPKEERKRAIEQARKIVAGIDDPNMKMMALSALASQIAKMGDKEAAGEIMREAERFVSPQPKNYMDFMQSWMLASGYSEIDPERAFPILEETVFRLNDTISAFIKVGEFIDLSGDLIENGEVQIGAFGGEMTNQMLRQLGATDTTLKNLANADFSRTKALTGKFDRTEIRILAKMLVLRAILGADKASTNKELEAELSSFQ